MLALVGYEFYKSHLIGGAPPAHTARWKRMESLQVGDLVIEMSTAGFWLHGDEPSGGPYAYLKVENAIGFLERITEEPFPRQEGEPPWDEEEEGQPEPLETVFYIKLLHDGSTFRWTNARFVTILPVEKWEKQR